MAYLNMDASSLMDYIAAAGEGYQELVISMKDWHRINERVE